MAGPVLIIFGITGDLSRRKLLPALYHLFDQGLLPEETTILGISRRAITPDEVISGMARGYLPDAGFKPDSLTTMQRALQCLQLDPTNSGDMKQLRNTLSGLDRHETREKIFYMSVPASAFKTIIEQIAEAGLNGSDCRILVEKPFGHDLKSAEALLKTTSGVFSENQIYRIDHYLAKETAQNLLAFRMHNPIFAPLWNGSHIRRVHIRALESLGIEGRVAFYEQTGALRDLIQSHLLQLLAITLMDAPATMDSAAIHTNKHAFLEQLIAADPAGARRAQYEPYRDEVKNNGSVVETYARVQLLHTSERWQNTEIILETGKGLHKKTTDITLEFKSPHEPRHNILTFHLQPDEGISLSLLVKEPGYENRMHATALGFKYEDVFHAKHIEAYERVLMDAVRKDQSLFASDKEIRESWRILQPIIDIWSKDGTGLASYPFSADPSVIDSGHGN